MLMESKINDPFTAQIHDIILDCMFDVTNANKSDKDAVEKIIADGAIRIRDMVFRLRKAGLL